MYKTIIVDRLISINRLDNKFTVVFQSLIGCNTSKLKYDFILYYLTLFNINVQKKPRKILQVRKQNMCLIVSGLNLPKPKGVKLIAQTKNLKDTFVAPKIRP